MNKKPQDLSTKLTHDLLKQNMTYSEAPFFVNSDIGVLHNTALPFLQFKQQLDAPLSISDYRFGIVLKGKARAIINLTEQHLEAGAMVCIGPGTIIQPLGMSPDAQIKGMAVFRNFPLPFSPERKPTFLNAIQPFLFLRPAEADLAIAEHLLDAVWNIVNLRYDQDVVSGLISAVFSHWNSVYLSQADHEQKASDNTQHIFDRFIQLVNCHAGQEHQIRFYADRLCLTERYLGTVVHQVSGVTAKEWIDRALITRIKIELKHTTKPFVQIAEELQFPNASFFTKYFKRLTGITPGEYRKG